MWLPPLRAAACTVGAVPAAAAAAYSRGSFPGQQRSPVLCSTPARRGSSSSSHTSESSGSPATHASPDSASQGALSKTWDAATGTTGKGVIAAAGAVGSQYARQVINQKEKDFAHEAQHPNIKDNRSSWWWRRNHTPIMQLGMESLPVRITPCDIPTRYRRLVSDAGIEALTKMINDLVDLDGFDEQNEQHIFEHSVKLVLNRLEEVLPDTHVGMIWGSGVWQDPQDGSMPLNETRMYSLFEGKVLLPFLEAPDEKRVILCVIHVLNLAIQSGAGVRTVCSSETSHKSIVVDVFIKTICGSFFNEDERKQLIGNVLGNIKNIPFVPMPMVEKIVDVLILSISKTIEQSLNEALEDVWGSGKEKTAIKEAEQSDQVVVQADADLEFMPKEKQGAFAQSLRRRLYQHVVRDAQSRFPWTAWLGGQKFRLAMLHVVDIIVAQTDTDRLEDVVAAIPAAFVNSDT